MMHAHLRRPARRRARHHRLRHRHLLHRQGDRLRPRRRGSMCVTVRDAASVSCPCPCTSAQRCRRKRGGLRSSRHAMVIWRRTNGASAAVSATATATLITVGTTTSTCDDPLSFLQRRRSRPRRHLHRHRTSRHRLLCRRRAHPLNRLRHHTRHTARRRRRLLLLPLHHGLACRRTRAPRRPRRSRRLRLPSTLPSHANSWLSRMRAGDSPLRLLVGSRMA